jgi:hypothetical protein
VIFSLLVMTRPDGLLFAAAGALSYWVPRDRLPPRARLALSVATLTPVIITLVVGIPVKLAYYGEILPTAFHSKSVLHPYYSQGLVYLGLYLAKNWFLVAAFALAAARWRLRGEAVGSSRGDVPFFLGACGVFVAYLVHVGGDFMFARRLVPAVPLLFLVMEEMLVRVAKPRTRALLAAAALIAASLPAPVYNDTRVRIRGVADEPRFYPPAVIAMRKHQAETVGAALAGTNARVAFEGGMCVFGYYSKLPYLVEMTGLTQYSLAKLPLEKRGHIGHEKHADAQWFAENDIHFLVRQNIPKPRYQRTRQAFDDVYFGDVAKARILLYSDEIMDALRDDPQISFVGIERVIENDRQQMPTASLEEAESTYELRHQYYFRAAGESGLEQARELYAIVERKRREAGE